MREGGRGGWGRRGCKCRGEAEGICTEPVQKDGRLDCFWVAVPTAHLGHLVRSFQHLHEESVNGCVADQLEEEKVLQAFQSDGSQRW